MGRKFNRITLNLWISLIIVFLIYSIFLLQLWRGVKKLPRCQEQRLLPVSLILAVRNEERLLEPCLTALAGLKYPKALLEMIVVDDGSADRTPALLAKFQQQLPAIKVITLTSGGNKKRALATGIEKSSGEILLFTDADCTPSPLWVREMVRCFAPEVGVVVGFSPLCGAAPTCWNRLLQLDSLSAGIVAAGAIGLNSAVTCTGRNLAYRRAAFEQVNGFSKISRSLSGDDDLLLQLIRQATNWKIRFNLNPDSFVPSRVGKNFSQIFQQKKRHLSAGKFYRRRIQLYYLVFHLTNLSLFVFFIVSFFLKFYFAAAAICLSGKILLDFLLFKKLAPKFDQTINLQTMLSWEIYFVLYHAVIAPLSWVGKIKWK